MGEALSTFEAGRLVLARMGMQASSELARALEQAVLLSARTLSVARVNVWLFDPAETTLHCLSRCELGIGILPAGQTLDTTSWPSYRAALQSRKFIAADDARNDPRTRELAGEYLVPLGITSMLDAPIFREGKVAGVVCHEHVGPKRKWLPEDMEFASSVSDMLTAMFEQAGRLAAEERLARAQRMEALGRLAAGVAHDFNGVLAMTMMIAEQFRASAQVPPELAEQAAELLRVAEVGKRLVSQLLSFAQTEAMPVENIDVAEVLRRMGPIFATLRSTAVVVEVPDAPLFASIDRSRFEQIVLNLTLNACDVTPQGGRVTVSVSMERARGAPWVTLRVKDEGPGIDPAMRERIFEPFFSTKSEGTGMGLALVLAISQKAGGTVEVESGTGGGAVFVVRLPAVD